MSPSATGTPPDEAAPRSRGLLRLRFPADLEREFRASCRAAARRWVRLSLLVALTTVLGFAVIDH